ncbi:hypothetical protein ACFYXJ_06795 [Streptomyces sp. NPDC002667]|uniref:hypothetical protein n=1 Tax=Streptomyces sp. NPDC002667 TaxID=3364657 RepID=UPI0036942511
MNEQWHRRQRPHAVEPAGPGHAPQPAVLVHELVSAAGTDGDEALRCARRLAAALPPRARDVLLDALTEADPRHDGDGSQEYESGGGLCFDGPEYALPAARSPLSLLPAYREPGPRDAETREAAEEREGPASVPGGGVWPEPRTDPPAAVIRLRFADALALERAGACFEGAWSDPGTGTLQVPGDAGVQTLRSVLAALDAAALAPESLTVHTNELDDVFAAFTTLL